MTNLFGFTLLRNAVKYDYCFVESLRSIQPIVKKTFVALGEGEDSTEEIVSQFKNIYITPTVWDKNSREGGLILSEQTNIALNSLRKYVKEKNILESSWGLYLQADEVLHHDDLNLLLKDIKKAEAQGCDAIDFRYFHFWQDHHHVAINKKWYPHEIRCIKLNSAIQSWGDAQSFKNVQKVYSSEARIFHYGHVRQKEKYLKKKADILKLYHTDQKIKKYQRREKRFDNQTEVLNYLGDHPLTMKQRIMDFGDRWEFPFRNEIHIVGNPGDYSPSFLRRINIEKIYWYENFKSVPFKLKRKSIVLNPTWYERLLFNNSPVPEKMRSSLARPWSLETQLTLHLSSRGYSVSPSSNDWASFKECFLPINE